MFALDAQILRTAVSLIAEILKRVTQVEKYILEEESRFASFTRWVRYGTSALFSTSFYLLLNVRAMTDAVIDGT